MGGKRGEMAGAGFCNASIEVLRQSSSDGFRMTGTGVCLAILLTNMAAGGISVRVLSRRGIAGNCDIAIC